VKAADDEIRTYKNFYRNNKFHYNRTLASVPPTTKKEKAPEIPAGQLGLGKFLKK